MAEIQSQSEWEIAEAQRREDDLEARGARRERAYRVLADVIRSWGSARSALPWIAQLSGLPCSDAVLDSQAQGVLESFAQRIAVAWETRDLDHAAQVSALRDQLTDAEEIIADLRERLGEPEED